MIDNEQEYQRMFEAERKLWWYLSLHKKILKEIDRNFREFVPDLKILDAACGTGGLLSALKSRGYCHISGFDYSRHAVSFSLKRELDVSTGDLRKTEDFRPGTTYDVICCNDALYFLNDREITSALLEFSKRLNKGGVILINIHAFEAFSGTHDIAVGSTRRFTLRDFKKYAAETGLKITYHTYWPFFLSLPILLVRSWQRLWLKKDALPADSDVKYPGDLINGILKKIMQLEEQLLPSAPFGSSLFLVLKYRTAE